MSEIKHPLIRRTAASEYLLEKHGISRTPNTLAKMATVGGGPVYRKDGNIPLYDPVDLDVYAESVLSPRVTSSSELSTLKQSNAA